ncbi:MAG: hypothetical protein KBD78_10380 [Oligoflexales bacterium]|nr:hypothetical protein [Oligoflexales bacterium]
MILNLYKILLFILLFINVHNDLLAKSHKSEIVFLKEAELYLNEYIDAQVNVLAILVKAFYNEKIFLLNKNQRTKKDIPVLSSEDKETLFSIYRLAEQRNYLLSTSLFEHEEYRKFFSKYELYGKDETYRLVLDSQHHAKIASPASCNKIEQSAVKLMTQLCKELLTMNIDQAANGEKNLDIFSSLKAVKNATKRSELFEKISLLHQLKTEDYKAALAYFLPKLEKDSKSKELYLKIQQTYAKRQQGSGQVGLQGL